MQSKPTNQLLSHVSWLLSAGECNSNGEEVVDKEQGWRGGCTGDIPGVEPPNLGNKPPDKGSQDRQQEPSDSGLKCDMAWGSLWGQENNWTYISLSLTQPVGWWWLKHI